MKYIDVYPSSYFIYFQQFLSDKILYSFFFYTFKNLFLLSFLHCWVSKFISKTISSVNGFPSGPTLLSWFNKIVINLLGGEFAFLFDFLFILFYFLFQVSRKKKNSRERKTYENLLEGILWLNFYHLHWPYLSFETMLCMSPHQFDFVDFVDFADFVGFVDFVAVVTRVDVEVGVVGVGVDSEVVDMVVVD